MKLIRCNTINGADRAAENMVGAMVAFGLLNGVNIEWLLDD